MRASTINILLMLALATCVACEVKTDVVDRRDDDLFHRSRVLAASYPTTDVGADDFNTNGVKYRCSTRPVNAACPGTTGTGADCGCNANDSTYNVNCCNNQETGCVASTRGSSTSGIARCTNADYQVLKCCKTVSSSPSG